MVKALTSSRLHHLHGLSLCRPSDAGDGGQAVRRLLEFLRLRGGGLWDGAKAEWQSDTTGANVAGAQRWILPSIAFHYAGCVGCKAFTCPGGVEATVHRDTAAVHAVQSGRVGRLLAAAVLRLLGAE